MDKIQYAWYWGEDEGNCSEPCNSIIECLEEARQENDGEYEKVFIGIVKDWESNIDIDSLIEEIQNNVYRDSEDTIEDYLDNVEEKHKKELGEELNRVFEKWKEKYNYKVYGFSVIEAKAYDI